MKTTDDIKYDCMTCPYPQYRVGHILYCDICICRIIDDFKLKKQGGNKNGQ